MTEKEEDEEEGTKETTVSLTTLKVTPVLLLARDEEGRRPLHWVAAMGDLPLLSYFIDMGADMTVSGGGEWW